MAIDHCPILAPALDGAISAAWDIAETLAGARKPLDIQATATESGLDVDLRGSGPLTAAHTAALARVADKHRLARLTRHGEIVAQQRGAGRNHGPRPRDASSGRIPAGDRRSARRYWRGLVAGALRRREDVADLFAGVGPFALRLAERARVTAADSDSDAIAALKRAAETTQGLKPVETQARDLFRRPFTPAELSGSTAWCSTRRAKAPRRRRERLPHHACRSWSRCRAIRRRSPATPAFSTTAATA